MLPRVAVLLLLYLGCDTSDMDTQDDLPGPQSLCSADWARDAVFYQIFPERFWNGDTLNDPVHASLDNVDRVPESWHVMPWTADWYARADWESDMGDEFYSSVFQRRYGGDLQGVMNRLDYLEELGVTAVYFNPLFHARSLHKYDGSSFHHIDPYFGPDPATDLVRMSAEIGDEPSTWVWTAADSLFLRLIAEMHARGLRVILDGVFNHTGRDFFAFADIWAQQAASPYASWYNVSQWDDPETEADEFDYEGWWGYRPLPVFSDSEDGSSLHPEVAQYVLAATLRWMDPNADGDPSDGIDGWRLDVATEVPPGFWRTWHEEVCALNPAAYTVGEIWDESAMFVAEAGFGGAMNYHGFAYPVKGFLVDGSLMPTGLDNYLDTQETPGVHLNLVDSHDTDRLASMIVNRARAEYARPERFDYDQASSPRTLPTYSVQAPGEHERRLQRMLVLLQMTWTNPPMIYYGSEAGMWGADDPDDRMPMVWPDLQYEGQSGDPLGRLRKEDPVTFDSTLFDYYRRAIAFRRKHSALRRGAVEVLAADDEQKSWAFGRKSEDGHLVVAFNRSDEVATLRLETLDPKASLHVEFVTQTTAPVLDPDSLGTTLTLPALTGAVLAYREPVR